MNRVELLGRLTKDPKVNDACTMATCSIAVDRSFKTEGQPTADFINLKWLGEKKANFAKTYLHKGMQLGITGSIQTGSYTDRNGNKVYTTDIIVDSTDFCGSKSENMQSPQQAQQPATDANGFVDIMSIPDGVEDIGLPFN